MPDTAEKIVSLSNLSRFKDKVDALKQDTLVSGTNIKTINSASLLGSGDISLVTKAENLKALYHLGEYDSVDTSNADYDLITRGTGYYNKKSANLAYYTDNSKQRWEMRNAGAVPPASLTTIPTTLVCNYSTYTIKSEQGAWDDNSGICITSTGGVSVYTQTLPDDFEIQYELATPYTEKVLKNQPLSQLDKNGENWLRGEYEKTLNLAQNQHGNGDINCYGYIDSGYPSNSGGTIQWYDVSLDANKPYTFSVNAKRGNSSDTWFLVAFQFEDNTYDQVAMPGPELSSSYQRFSKTYTPSKRIVRFFFGVYSWEKYIVIQGDSVMLTEGSVALPYQPYNGKIMHEGDMVYKSEEILYGNFAISSTMSLVQGASFTLDEPSIIIATMSWSNAVPKELAIAGSTGANPSITGCVSATFVDAGALRLPCFLPAGTYYIYARASGSANNEIYVRKYPL